MDQEVVRRRLLDAAETLFYARGIQVVGIDAIRAESGVSLKRLYSIFPGKEALVEGFLQRRDLRWRQALADHVAEVADPDERILAVFDWLDLWFREPTFRGCAWINSYGELGAVSPAVARLAREHKQAFSDYLAGLVADAGLPASLTAPLVLLAEGAMVTAGIFATPGPAAIAKSAARVLAAAGDGA